MNLSPLTFRTPLSLCSSCLPGLLLAVSGHLFLCCPLMEGHPQEAPGLLPLKSKGKNRYILDIVLSRISCVYEAGHPQITSGQVAWGIEASQCDAEGHGVDHEAILTWPISSYLWLSLNEPQGMPTVWKIETLRLRLKTL